MQTGDCEVPDQSGTGVLFDERKMVVAVARTDDYENTVSNTQQRRCSC